MRCETQYWTLEELKKACTLAAADIIESVHVAQNAVKLTKEIMYIAGTTYWDGKC